MAKKFKETYPEDIPSISSIKLQNADGINTINSITKENNNKGSIEQTQQELMNDKGYGITMVGKKGHAFPMLQPDPVEEQKKKMMEQQGIVKPENRAGSAEGRNILVNNPNNPQPANKVSANVNGREQMFNTMASNPGQPFPDASTTPPAPIFPNQQGSFAAYANPKRVSENLSGVDVDAEGGLKGIMDKFKKKRNTKVGDPVTPEKPEDPAMYDGPEFNAGLKNAMKGKEGKFADMVADAPGMYDGLSKTTDPPTKEEKANSGIKPFWGIEERGVEPFKEDPDDWSDGPGMYDGLSKRKKKKRGKAPQTGKRLDEGVNFDNFPPTELGVGGDEEEDFDFSMYNKAPGMHEKHTQISKANVNSAMRDDAAHASYLKRDINYDNRHGGSKKQMTADERHISKLAGDIKYDVKKKRKYDNV